MNWRIEKSCRIESTEIDHVKLWNVDLLEPAVSRLALGLCLLSNNLVAAMDLVGMSGDVLSISKHNKPGTYAARVAWRKKAALIELSPIELEALMTFCLLAVRDGVAQVDHVDIEATSARSGEQDGSFVLKFPQAAPPVSAEEARRRLGL